MDWLIMKERPEKGAARFGDIENAPEKYRLRHGVSLKDEFPAEAQIQMRKSAPDEIGLVDCLRTMAADSLIINDKVCQLLEREGVKNVELLPIKVLNHKGKAVKERYFVLNILTMTDCVDLKQSKLEMNTIDPTIASSVEKLVIDPAKIPTGLKLCRTKTIKYEILAHRSLAEKIAAEKLKGIVFVELAAYRS